MTDENPKRFDRIVAILIQLQSKRIVKAQDLADRFQVSLRTIYRDIRSLESSGVPILSEAGSGYSIMEGYRLPPVMFTREEAGSFVAAEKLMQQLTDKSLNAYFHAAMCKIKSVLRNKEKDWIDSLESQIHVHTPKALFNDNIPDALEVIMESIAEKKQVTLLYQALKADEAGERIIEPVGLFNQNHYWYIIGYCLLRQDYRQFRTDRIMGIRRKDTPFTTIHGKMDEYLNKNNPKEKTKVRILVDNSLMKYIRTDLKHYGFESEKPRGSKKELSFMCCDVENSFTRWYLMFGDHAEILEPESLRQSVAAVALKMLENLKVPQLSLQEA